MIIKIYKGELLLLLLLLLLLFTVRLLHYYLFKTDFMLDTALR